MRLLCSLCGEPAHTHTHFKGLQDLWRSSMRNPIMQFFGYKHLPTNPVGDGTVSLQSISAEVAEVSYWMEAHIPDNAEKSAGMRKLLEAKDCFVRAALPEESNEG